MFSSLSQLLYNRYVLKEQKSWLLPRAASFSLYLGDVICVGMLVIQLHSHRLSPWARRQYTSKTVLCFIQAPPASLLISAFIYVYLHQQHEAFSLTQQPLINAIKCITLPYDPSILIWEIKSIYTLIFKLSRSICWCGDFHFQPPTSLMRPEFKIYWLRTTWISYAALFIHSL